MIPFVGIFRMNRPEIAESFATYVNKIKLLELFQKHVRAGLI